MKRIGILTAGGDTPALNATIYGAVRQAGERGLEVVGILDGFGGLMDERCPHILLNPLGVPIPELNPCRGGTILGASRTYIAPDDAETARQAAERLRHLKIEGLICVGGDGTLNGMQPLSADLPCVLAPKTIDNDLGLNYLDEPNDWKRNGTDAQGNPREEWHPREEPVLLEEIVNYATPGFATAVFVVAQGVRRIRTTAESHRRIAVIEVMGRDSGYIALGSAYGQPDIILIPEVPIDYDRLENRVRELYELQKHVVIVVGEGVVDRQGRPLGEIKETVDPAGNKKFSGAAEHLGDVLAERLGDACFAAVGRHSSARSGIFTRKVGHTQRGGRPIEFDRFFAAQLGGKAVELLCNGHNNTLATLQWCPENGFTTESLTSNKLRDRWGVIHPRHVHPSLFDAHRFQPSRLGVEYLLPIFTNAIGCDDLEEIRTTLFASGNLSRRYQSINIDIQKRVRYL